MATAREILDERLARGEISSEEHANLIAQISQQSAAPKPGPTLASGMSLPKASAFWGYGGIGVAIFVVVTFASVSRQAITDCVRTGAGNIAFCQENGVNWGFIYTMYGVAALCALSGISHLVRLKR